MPAILTNCTSSLPDSRSRLPIIPLDAPGRRCKTLLPQRAHDAGHLNGRHCALIALIASLAPCPVKRLFTDDGANQACATELLLPPLSAPVTTTSPGRAQVLYASASTPVEGSGLSCRAREQPHKLIPNFSIQTMSDLLHGLSCQDAKDDRYARVGASTQGAACRGVDDCLIVRGRPPHLYQRSSLAP